MIILPSCQSSNDSSLGSSSTSTSTGGLTVSEKCERWHCSTLEQYNDFFDMYYTSPQFITYDMLSDLGEFETFYHGIKFPTNYEQDVYDFYEEYDYILTKDDGFKLEISVLTTGYCAPMFDPAKFQHIDEKPDSFLTSELSKIEYNGIYYWYSGKAAENSNEKELYEVYLTSNGNYIAICAFKDNFYVPLSDYLGDDLIEEDNLLSYLVSEDPHSVELSSKYLNVPDIKIEKLENGDVCINGSVIKENMKYPDIVEIIGSPGTNITGLAAPLYVWYDTFDKEKLCIQFVCETDENLEVNPLKKDMFVKSFYIE